jgi:hypothetical protein
MLYPPQNPYGDAGGESWQRIMAGARAVSGAAEQQALAQLDQATERERSAVGAAEQAAHLATSGLEQARRSLDTHQRDRSLDPASWAATKAQLGGQVEWHQRRADEARATLDQARATLQQARAAARDRLIRDIGQQLAEASQQVEAEVEAARRTLVEVSERGRLRCEALADAVNQLQMLKRMQL